MRSLLPFLLPLSLACDPSPGDTIRPDLQLQLRTYDVPRGYSEQLADTLRLVLPTVAGDERFARSRVGPDGRLVVVAPQGLQQGIAELVAQLESAPAVASGPTVRMQYWVVLGVPGGDAETSSSLERIAPALTAITDAQGPQSFHLLEYLSMRGESGFHADASGRHAEVAHVASVVDGRVMAQLDIDLRGLGEISTRMNVRPGQSVVLGEAGIDAGFLVKQAPELGLNLGDHPVLYYIVVPSVEEASAG